jgi:hypothetical protein
VGVAWEAFELRQLETARRRGRELLDEAAFGRALAEGRALTPEATVAVARRRVA